MKILLAVDGSEYSQAAAAAIAARPWPAGSEVKVISAVELPFVPTPETWALPESYYTQLEESAKEAAQQAVRQASECLLASAVAQLKVSTEIIHGQAKEVILAEAEQWGADLLVVGSHGYSGWQRFWLGSVSHAVATHAPCSVEIVRQRKEH